MVHISWDTVCKAKEQGGLGVLDLKIHNQALLIKFLHKFFNRADIPQVNIIWETHYQDKLPSENKTGSFWWRTVLKHLSTFKQHAICKAGQGNTVMFWTDNCQDLPLQLKYPELHSYAIKQNISLHSVLQTTDIGLLFHRPMSQEAFVQVNALEDLLNNKVVSTGNDIQSYTWSAPKYSSIKMYKANQGNQQAHNTFRLLWKHLAV